MSCTYVIDKKPRYASSGSRSRIRQVLSSFTAAASFGKYEPFSAVPDEFTEYESYNIANWDGYGAEPITTETCETARAFRRLLPREIFVPDIAPGSDGTIGFEWREGPPDNRKLILVDVGPGNLITARIIHTDNRVERFPSTSVGIGARDLYLKLFPSGHASSDSQLLITSCGITTA